MTARIVVVGDVGVDVQVDLTGPLTQVHGGQDSRSRIITRPGGAGGNAAAWMARTNARVSLIARVGDDPAGVLAGRELRSAGVDCLFTLDADRPTCTVVVLVAPDGERTMFSDRGAGAALSPDDITLPDTDRGHLHLSGYLLYDAASRAAGLAALERARTVGWTTSVDPQSSRHLHECGAEQFLDWAGSGRSFAAQRR